MAELNIHYIKYNNIVSTAQPIGKKSVLITIHGCAEINCMSYSALITLVIRMDEDTFKIINQIFEIFT
jgi:hypothetical protein